jgi:phosphatidylserine/phosphatidylglycerophosphate/cardiolipin synthase-like enzyme
MEVGVWIMRKLGQFTAVMLSAMLGACAVQPGVSGVGPQPVLIPAATAPKPAVVPSATAKPAAPLKVAPPAVVAKAETAAIIKETGATVSVAEQAEGETFFAKTLADLADLPDTAAEPVAAAAVEPDQLPDFFVSPDPVENETELLFDDAIFPDLLQHLQGAQKRIQISYFLLGGDIGLSIAQILAERQRAGVEVQVMLDPSLGLAGKAAEGIARVVDYLQQANIKFRLYPLALFGPMPNKIQKKFQINHNKIAVMDGQIAYAGGMNLDDMARVNHDLLVRIEGPTAAEYERMLDAEWKFGNEYTMSTKAAGMIRLSETAPQERTTKDLLLKAFAAAKTSIHVAMYEFGDLEIANGLIDAYKRGVDVRVLMDPKAENLKKYGAAALPDGMPNILPAREFLKNGVQVHWFKPWRNDQELHMKAVCIDGSKLIAGSTNWTTNAFTRWRETSFQLEGATAAKFDAEFDRMWTTTSVRLEKLSFKQQLTARLTEYVNRKDYAFW